MPKLPYNISDDIKNQCFDFTNDDLENIEIRPYTDVNKKATCRIYHKNSCTRITQFKLSQNKQVNIYCDCTFYPKNKFGSDRYYIPRLVFTKINEKTGLPKEQSKLQVRINLNEGDVVINFWKLINFFKKYKDLVDTGNFDDCYSVINSSFIQHFNNLEDKQQMENLQEILNELKKPYSEILKILNVSKHKALKTFEDMLHSPNGICTYKIQSSITQRGDEVAWQDFFEKNDWILSLGVSYKYISDFKREQIVGIANTDKVGASQTDFLGIDDYTVLIELKTPEKQIFCKKQKGTNGTGRTNTWAFTSDFIDGISQCLAQKSSWDKNERQIPLTDPKGSYISPHEVRTVDPKTVFIIGNKEKNFQVNLKIITTFLNGILLKDSEGTTRILT